MIKAKFMITDIPTCPLHHPIFLCFIFLLHMLLLWRLIYRIHCTSIQSTSYIPLTSYLASHCLRLKKILYKIVITRHHISQTVNLISKNFTITPSLNVCHINLVLYGGECLSRRDATKVHVNKKRHAWESYRILTLQIIICIYYGVGLIA